MNVVDDDKGIKPRATTGEIVRGWLGLVGLLAGLFVVGFTVYWIRRHYGNPG